MSMAELAEELGMSYNSRNAIRHRVEKYFPEEWKNAIKRERRPHTKTKRRDKINTEVEQ